MPALVYEKQAKGWARGGGKYSWVKAGVHCNIEETQIMNSFVITLFYLLTLENGVSMTSKCSQIGLFDYNMMQIVCVFESS